MVGSCEQSRGSEVKRLLPPCRVCGDKAAGLHYGVNTCEACKGFFHRSLGRYAEYKCRANRTSGYCEYKPGKRKSCQYCRYQKCLNAGMSKEAIKTGRYTYHKRTEDTREVKKLKKSPKHTEIQSVECPQPLNLSNGSSQVVTSTPMTVQPHVNANHTEQNMDEGFDSSFSDDFDVGPAPITSIGFHSSCSQDFDLLDEAHEFSPNYIHTNHVQPSCERKVSRSPLSQLLTQQSPTSPSFFNTLNTNVQTQPNLEVTSFAPSRFTTFNSSISRSVSPLPSSDPEDEYLNEIPFSRPDVQPSYGNITSCDISALFADQDEVVRALVTSHKMNIGDFSYMPKEEMSRQQRAHFESCQLKANTFGTLEFIPEHEYDEIYSVTGIDIDNRRNILHNYLQRMERCVRGMVQFSKSIPGFSCLDLETQVNLIKLARFEFSTFTLYPTVNLELGVSVGLGGRWTCRHDSDLMGEYTAVREYMRFCDKLQKLNPSNEEIVLLKAILVLTTDRDSSVQSSLAQEIHWQLCQCLYKVVRQRHNNPGIRMANYILALAESRTVAEHFNDVLRALRMEKYSSIEQNPLLLEMYSTIINETTDFSIPCVDLDVKPPYKLTDFIDFSNTSSDFDYTTSTFML